MLKIHLEYAANYLEQHDYDSAMGHLLQALTYAERNTVWSRIMQALKYVRKAMRLQQS